MLNKANREISGIVSLVIVLCGCVLIGNEQQVSVAAAFCIFIELIIGHFVLKEHHYVQLIYSGMIIVEILFLLTNEFWLFVLVNLLFLIVGVWNLFFFKTNKKILNMFYKGIMGLFTVFISVLFMIDIYAKPITKPVQLSYNPKVTIDENRLDSQEEMLREIEKMNSFGSRTTGSKGHNQFIAWLKNELTDMGLKVHSDRYTFDRWEEEKSAVYIGGKEVLVSSAYPYSGETDENGVTGELVYTTKDDYKKAKGKIAVIQIDNSKRLPAGLIMNERYQSTLQNHVMPGDGDLVLTTALQDANLEKAKKEGVLAVILVWKGVSDEKAKDQYVPFTSDYAGIPAVWINQTNGNQVIEAAKSHKDGTVILQANRQDQAFTESFYVTIEGKNKKEAIIINSHTDGVNVVEENGAVGMLSMIRYLQQNQPERTMVFAFVTGHFRLPVFKGTSQASSTWMQAHKELWDGEEGNMKAVAGITVEHLGSMEWKDDASGTYHSTGKIQTEYVYTGNEMMAAVWRKADQERKLSRCVLLRGHNQFEFGESQPLFEAGIPVIGFIPTPDYLLTNSQNREMDKFNVLLMHKQIESLLKATQIIDQMPTNIIGKSDHYSYFYGRTDS